jgi:DNA-binding transcriptional ArsR family regulator
MISITDQLHQYVEAISEPTRGAILGELHRLGEATPAQLARRLDVPANNIYHHMRVLLRLGVVDPPRAVPSESYVEKYYRVNPRLHGALRLDPDWYRELDRDITAEDRQAALVSTCLTMAILLRAAARHLQRQDPEELDRDIHEHQHVALAVNPLSREQLNFRLAGFNDVLHAEDRKFAEDTTPRTDMMLMATIPDMWLTDPTNDDR